MSSLSIIVPVYNVEPYLKRCIDSILDQTFKDFELILIDDGSPDGCPKICDEYSRADDRVTVVHQKNAGVSSARNAGLKIAKGKYIGFVDPDDYIERDMYELMMNEAKKNSSDIVCVNWLIDNGSEIIQNKLTSDVPETMDRITFVKHIFDSPRTIAGSSCNKIFLRSKLESQYDTQVKICEDNLFLLEYCKNIVKASYIRTPKYYIYLRENSATKNMSALVKSLNVRKKIIDISDDIDSSCRKLAEKDYLDTALGCLIQLRQQGSSDASVKVVKSKIRFYVRKNLISFIMNDTIYWKTKIAYLKFLF